MCFFYHDIIAIAEWQNHLGCFMVTWNLYVGPQRSNLSQFLYRIKKIESLSQAALNLALKCLDETSKGHLIMITYTYTCIAETGAFKIFALPKLA